MSHKFNKKTKINILFWIRDGKNINCRITINRVKANRPLGISCIHSDWNIKTKRTKNPIHNAFLANLESKLIERHYELLILQKENPHSAEQLAMEVIDGLESPIESFEVLAREWLALRKAMVGKALEYPTYQTNISRINNMLDFIKDTKNKYKSAAVWNNGVARELEAWINTNRGGNNHAGRVIADVCRIFKYAEDKGYFSKQLVTYSISKLPPHNASLEPLSIKEIQMIEDLDLSNESEALQRTKDAMLLQCYTGFAFAELTRVERKHIVIDDDKNADWNEWIIIDRKKTRKRQPKPCIIPLVPKAKAILEKCGYQLPKFYNSDYNINIRAIICRLGIEKEVTSHLCRKTFGNILFEQGMSVEAISSAYGHSNTKITLSAYIKMKKTRVGREIKAIYNSEPQAKINEPQKMVSTGAMNFTYSYSK